MKPYAKNPFSSLHLFLFAGLAGGLAEVAWVSLYGFVERASTFEVAREITATVIPAASHLAVAPALGILIHFTLSLLLATVFGVAIWAPRARRFGRIGIMASSVIALAAVWAINFFLVLPAWNPAFVTLLPLGVTLASKALFGISMGMVLSGGQQQLVGNRWISIGGSPASMR